MQNKVKYPGVIKRTTFAGYECLYFICRIQTNFITHNCCIPYRFQTLTLSQALFKIKSFMRSLF